MVQGSIEGPTFRVKGIVNKAPRAEHRPRIIFQFVHQILQLTSSCEQCLWVPLFVNYYSIPIGPAESCSDQTSGPRLAAAHIAVAAITGGPAAAHIAVAAIAGRCHLPSSPVQHRRRREKPQLLLSSGTEENPDDPSQSITLRPSLHDRRRRYSIAVPSSSPHSSTTCPSSPLKKKKATGLQLCSETETIVRVFLRSLTSIALIYDAVISRFQIWTRVGQDLAGETVSLRA
ncbi:hypothetical protein MRB53_020638 [Persea americana]|uniref:Uncharacterized protein n=1 Tax=Persea americana TaxID=3435 RepID=A0ACC2L1R0_PERAE|nr:hypothetical protein MRB53_020638 [Persea americana]